MKVRNTRAATSQATVRTRLHGGNCRIRRNEGDQSEVRFLATSMSAETHSGRPIGCDFALTKGANGGVVAAAEVRRRYGNGVTGTAKLYIFPHAGGSTQYYIPFARTFSSDVKRIAVQYPGRRGAHDLAAFTSISDLADGVSKMISPHGGSDGGIAFFGHSMGGLVAFEVARRFEAMGHPVAALFVSACAAPGRSGYDHIPESDKGLLSAVSEMTGANPEFLENEEFAARILPTLRGFKAITNYECPPDATLSCPIYAYLGDDDEVATQEKVLPWAQRTTAEFVLREFKGHHFYLDDHLADLVSDVEDKMSLCCGSR